MTSEYRTTYAPLVLYTMRVIQWATLVAWAASTIKAADLNVIGLQLESPEPPAELILQFPNHVVVEREEKYFFVYDLEDISPDLPDLGLASSDDEYDEPQTP